MGGDSFFQLEDWYHPEVVMQYVDLLVFSRNGVEQEQMAERQNYLTQKYHARIHLLEMRESPVSSSEIRRHIRDNQSIRGMVPAVVEEYIQQNHLYYGKAETGNVRE
jgi:nicotinate-nucleotide adenylyltransferase